MKLALQGITIVFASGDSGVAGSSGSTSCLGSSNNVFVPDYPATCPWITVAGATGLYTNNPTTEVAASDDELGFYSGGGFSNLFNTADYQTDAVNG